MKLESLEQLFMDQSRDEERFSEISEMTAALLRFPGDRLATFTCSFGAADASEYKLVGTKGTLRVDPAYELAEAIRHELKIGGKTRSQTFSKRDQFAPELIHFSECIQKGLTPEPSGEEGLADVRIIEALN